MQEASSGEILMLRSANRGAGNCLWRPCVCDGLWGWPPPHRTGSMALLHITYCMHASPATWSEGRWGSYDGRSLHKQQLYSRKRTSLVLSCWWATRTRLGWLDTEGPACGAILSRETDIMQYDALQWWVTSHYMLKGSPGSLGERWGTFTGIQCWIYHNLDSMVAPYLAANYQRPLTVHVAPIGRELLSSTAVPAHRK